MVSKIANPRYFPHCSSDKGLNGTMVNRTCQSINGGSLEFTSTSCLFLIIHSNKFVWREYPKKKDNGYSKGI